MTPSHTVTLPLNPQQRQLLEQAIARGLAPDLQGLVRRALREYRPPVAATPPKADAR